MEQPMAFKTLVLTLTLLFLASCSSSHKPIVIAHRGASGYLPEHTLEATAFAHALNPNYIEPDIVLTKDNIPIVLHDIHLESTTNVEEVFPNKRRKDGRWYAIDFNLKEIKKLKVHERFNNKKNKPYFKNRFPQDIGNFKVPTFKEIIDLVEGLNISTNKNIGLYPEIKKPAFHLKESKDITKIVYNFMLENELNKKLYPTIIQCFDPKELKRLKFQFKSKFSLVQLIAENSWNESAANYDYLKTSEGLKEIASYADGIGSWIPQLAQIHDDGNYIDTSLTKMAHKVGLFVHAYTFRKEQVPSSVTDEKLLSFLFDDLKIEGLFADQPDIVLNYLKH